MNQAKKGDKVKVHYSGRLRSGETFDSSQGGEPLEFTVGSGQMIKGFDQGVEGMQVGEKKTVEIPVEDAYGEKDPNAVFEFPKNQFPPHIQPEVGMQLAMNDGQGHSIPVLVTAVKDDVVVLDANHQLAGEDLIFDIELMEIAPSSRIILPK